MAQFWGVDANIAINYEESNRFVGTDDVLIMHVAEIDAWSCVGPVARIFKFKAHSAHIISNFIVAHRLAINKRLLYYNLEFATFVASETKYSEPCFRKIGIVK